MKTRIISLLFLVTLLLPSISFISDDPSFRASAIDLPITGYPQQDGGSDDRLFEYRSMWLEGYQIVNISEIRSLVKFARDHNFNCLSPLINGHTLGVFYNSTIFPKYIEVKWDFDPLMELIKEAHKYNIHVMPWFHTLYSRPALAEHPEWRDRSSYGSYSSYWMDPSNPEVRDFLINVTTELFENYPLDGIKLDTIRYGGSSYGYTPYAQQKYIDENWTDYSDFRRNQVTEVVEILYNTITGIRPWAWIGADIWHRYWSWYSYVYQDSRTWASKGIIDFVTTMSYTTSRTSFSNNLEDNLNSFNVPVVSGPYVYVPGNTAHGSVPNEQAGIDLLLDQTTSSQSLGALGTCNFAYKFLRAYPSYAIALRDGPFAEKALCPLKEQNIPVDTKRWDFEKNHDNMGWRTTNMGQFYPLGGSWSVVNSKEPSFMSPLLNMTSFGINVIEVRMRTDMVLGNLSIYWSKTRTEFLEHNKVVVDLKNTRDWNLYSIHLDESEKWQGPIRYVRVVPKFTRETNITIDSIRLTWMPYCIRTWAYLGPFYTGASLGLLEREFIYNETSVLPKIGDIDSGRRWGRYSMERDLVDLGFVLDEYKDTVTYSHIYIRSTFEGVLEMRHGNADGSRIWLNNEEVFFHNTRRSVSPDQNITFIVIRKGLNTLLMKQAVYGEDLSFFFRFTQPGNISVEGLEFLEDLPIMGSPSIVPPPDSWLSSSNISVEWDMPELKTDFDHFEVKLDDEDPVRTTDTKIAIKDLLNGEHMVHVRCVDNLGLPGKGSSAVWKVDTQIPRISEPVSLTPIVYDPVIKWKWEDLETPVSGIEKYLVTIESWLPGNPAIKNVVENEEVHTNSYTFDKNLDDAHRYRIIIEAVSGSGLSYTTSSGQSVLLDLYAPSAPSQIYLEHMNIGSRSHILTWTGSIENTKEGISHYEVWRSVEKDAWELYEITTDTSMVIERPLGKVLRLKVRAKDNSKLFGDFSEIRFTTNSPPEPWIEMSNESVEGGPIEFRTNGMIDDDGTILQYKWYINDQLTSKEKVFRITLASGIHTVSLWVIDDQGAEGKVTESFTVPKGIDNDINSTLQRWLEGTSIQDLHLPPANITHYNNRTEILEIVENDNNDLFDLKSVLADLLIVISASIMIILIMIVFIFLFVGEISGYGAVEIEDERPIELDWEEKAVSDRKKFMESLTSSPLLQRMIEQKQQQKGFRAAPPLTKMKLKDGAQSRTIMKYERPPPKKEVRTEIIEEWDEIDIMDEDVEDRDDVWEVED